MKFFLKKNSLGFIINILIAIIFSWVSYERIQNQKDLNLLEDNHNKITLSITKSLSIINSNDNYSKAYVITGNEKYLDQLNLGGYSLQHEVEFLKSQFENNKEQKKRMEELEKLLSKTFLNTNQFIELRKYKNFEAARDFINGADRIPIPNNIIKTTTQLVDTEDLEFNKKRNQKNKLEQVLKIAFFILFFC